MPDAPSFSNFPTPGSLERLAHLSSLLGWTIVAACALFWLAMLVDCLRRPAFYPLLGNTWRTRIFWVLTFALLNPLITLTYLFFGRLLPPKPKASRPVSATIVGLVLLLAAGQLWPSSPLPQIVRFHRDPVTGQMKLEAGAASAGLGINASATESTNSQTSTFLSGGSHDSLLPCEHFVILGGSTHPLMQKVAGLLCEKMAGLHFVKSAEYYPPGKLPPTGGQCPDMIVMLDAPTVNQASLPGFSKITCTVEVSAGQVPWPSSHHVEKDDYPPIFKANYNSRLEHTSKIKGMATADARYNAVAKSVIEQIEGGFLKTLCEWTGKHTNTSHLPATFFGQYTAPKEPFFASPPASWNVALSGARIFEHNHTVWRFEDDRSSKEVLTVLQQQLTPLGFRTEDLTVPYLRMSKGEQEVEIYRLRSHEPTVTDDAPTRPQSFVCIYHLRFTDDERCRAIEDLLASATSADQLVPFRHRTHSCNGLSDRLLERIAQLPATSAEAFLALADWHHTRGEHDAARTRLRGAVALAWADDRKGELDSQLKELGRKLGVENVTQSQPSGEDLLQTGIPQLPANGTALERSLAVGEPLRAWFLASSGELAIARCAVLRGEKADEPYRLSITVGDAHGSATSSIGISPMTGAGQNKWFTCHGVGNNDVTVRATATSDEGETFRVTAQVDDSTTRPAPRSQPE